MAANTMIAGMASDSCTAINPISNPNFDPMRIDPHFVKTLTTVGLTEVKARAQARRTAHPTSGRSS